jgi:hypothetical protein
MIEFLKDDIDTVSLNLLNPIYHKSDKDDRKDDKKLLKAYKTILKYYGVDYGK